MSAAKVAKSAVVSKSSTRKAPRRRAGTKPAVVSREVGLVSKTPAQRSVGRESVSNTQIARPQGQSRALEQKGEIMIKRAVVEEPVDEKAARQDNPVTDVERAAQDDTESTAHVAERESAADSTLSKYFREMAQHRVLTPKEEIEAAQKVERLEIGYWDALFGYPPAFETVAAVLERHVPESRCPSQQSCASSPARQSAASCSRRSKRGGTNRRTAWQPSCACWTAIGCSSTESYQAVHRLAGMYSVERDIEGDEVRITAAFKRYLVSVEKAAGRRATRRTASSRRTCASWCRSLAATTAVACR